MIEEFVWASPTLKQGQVYRLVLDDCCIVGEIQGALFLRAEGEKLVFDVGTFTLATGIKCYEVGA